MPWSRRRANCWRSTLHARLTRADRAPVALAQPIRRASWTPTLAEPSASKPTPTAGSSSCVTRAWTAPRSAIGSRYRGDSLWWFAELYLHKRRVIVEAFRAPVCAASRLAATRPVATLGSRRRATPVVARVAAEVAPTPGHPRARARLGATRPIRRSAARRAFTRRPRWRIACDRALRRRPARPAASSRSCTARSRAAMPARRPTLGPVLARLDRASRRRPPVVRRPRAANELPRAWLVRSVREFADPGRRDCRDARGLPSRGGVTLAPSRMRVARGAQVATALRRQRRTSVRPPRVAGCDLWPLVAPSSKASPAAVALVGARDGRSRRGARSRSRRTSC